MQIIHFNVYKSVLIILGLISKANPQPRFCNNVDLSAFCILDNHFKILLENATSTGTEYYEQFKEIVNDIFSTDAWIDDDRDPGFAPRIIANDTPTARTVGQSVYSFQDMCDLKTNLFMTGAGPDQFSKNPYQVEATEVTVKGIRLHNHLHFRIFSQDAPDPASKATGLIRYAFIIVHDKHGWPVGDFDTGVPCDEDCNCIPGGSPRPCHQSKFADTIPCMFTSSTAVTHPGQLMIYNAAGLKEIHATYRFAQSTSPASFTTELHVKTLLLESAAVIKMERDCRINYRFTNMFISNDSAVCKRPRQANIPCMHVPRTGKFGWTAQYNILWPTIETLGAWDYFPRGFIKKKDVKCHNPLSSKYYFSEPYPSYGLTEALLSSAACTPSGDQKFDIPDTGPALITGGLNSLYSKIGWEPEVKLYHGVPPQSFFPIPLLHQPNMRPRPAGTPTFQLRFPKLADIAKDERCRCPRMGTTEPPPNKRAPPVGQLEGRKDHAIQMTIAWIVLVPFAIWVSRFYKETYSKVFFLQEFWWYTIHVLCLILAAMFMTGGIYAIEIKREEPFNYEDTNQLLHAVLGSLALLMFALHLLMGHQRFKKPEVRRVQIFFHWMFGLAEYFLALFSMLNAAWILAGCMSCFNFAFVVSWVVIQLIFYVVMEIHMRKVDKELHLVPKRSYLPPPVMRLFHVSAPGSKFRIIMLVLYFMGCVFNYGIMHYFIEFTRAYRSCFNFDLEFERMIVQFQPN